MTTGYLTVIKGEIPDVLGKVFELKAGVLDKTTAGHLTVGTYSVEPFSNAGDLVALLESVGTDGCITASLPLETLPQSGHVVSRNLLAEHPGRYPGAITRTKADMTFRHGAAGVMALDYDPPAGEAALSPAVLWSLLQATISGVETAGVIHWCSGSSYIYNGDSEAHGLRGQRVYILVADAGEIPRAADVLADRLWLAGYGRVIVSAGGAKLKRHVFDDAMKEAARLDYCGGAHCKPPLSQRRGAPVVLSDGGFLDTRVALPDLTASEAAKVEGLKAEAMDAAEVEAAAVKEARALAKGTGIAAKLVTVGVPYAEAHERGMQAARSAAGGVLLGDYTLTLENGVEVTVGQILDDKERYHGAICRDPVEPEYLGGKAVGKLYLYGASPLLHSFAHGGATYRLHRQPARIYLQAGRRAESCDEIMGRLGAEPDIFMKGGVLVRLDAGRLVPVARASGVGYLVGTRFALFRRDRDGKDTAADLDDATSNMLLAAIGN